MKIAKSKFRFVWSLIHTKTMYFNYHGKAKRLIDEGHLVEFKFFDKWNGVSPALVLFFDNARPMPIRPHKWKEYETILRKIGMEAASPDNS